MSKRLISDEQNKEYAKVVGNLSSSIWIASANTPGDGSSRSACTIAASNIVAASIIIKKMEQEQEKVGGPR